MLGSFEQLIMDAVQPAVEAIQPNSISLNQLLREMVITKTDNSVIVDRKKFERFEELLLF